VWTAVREQLLADPLNAPLDVVVPDAPEPDPPPAAFEFKNEIADPVTGELITFQELSIRSHQRRVASLAKETDYQRIERAKALAGVPGGVRPAAAP
jgi:hypothetical protein